MDEAPCVVKQSEYRAYKYLQFALYVSVDKCSRYECTETVIKSWP